MRLRCPPGCTSRSSCSAIDLTLELSEWQNGWFTDYVWQSG